MSQASYAPSRTERYLDFMLCILRADGVVTAEEQEYWLSSLIDDASLSAELQAKYRQLVTQKEWSNLDDQIQAIGQGLDPSTLAGMVRDAYITASLVGNLGEAEVEVVRKLLRAAGVSEDLFESVEAWAREGVAHLKRGYRLLT